MKNSKFNFKSVFFAVLFALAAIFSACSENSPLGTSNEEINPTTGMAPATIRIEPYWVGNVLMFRVRNNSQDTIVNDFHVQFNRPVKITGWVTMAGWQIDAASTDTAHGKIGVKKTPQGQPIPPMGGVGDPLGVQIVLKNDGRNDPRQWWDYTWQATRDGIVVKEGKDVFPPR